MDFSIVVPVYNEQDNLAILTNEIIEAMDSTKKEYEILYINDASTDRSEAIITTLQQKYPHIRSFSFLDNCGQSAALALGFEKATGTYIITLDADLQNDPHDILKLIPHLDRYDMVTGWRKARHDSIIKKFDSRFANTIRNWLSRETIHDTGCSLKIMKRNYLQHIKFFKGLHRFLPTLMKMEGATVLEVPVSHRSRKYGTSKYGTWDRAFSGLRDLLAIRWMQDRFIRYQIKE